MSKDAIFFVLDVGQSMDVPTDNGVSNLDAAKNILRMIVSQKILFGAKNDLAGLVLVNVSEASNDMDYEGCEVRWNLARPSVDFLEAIESISSESGNGDVMSGVIVAVGKLKEKCKKLKYRKRIYVLTDGSGTLEDQDQYGSIATGIKNYEVELKIIFCTSGEKGKNYDIWHKFIKKDLGGGSKYHIFDKESASANLEALATKRVKRNPVAKYSLEFGEDESHRIKVHVATKTKKNNPPSIKKQSKIGTEKKVVQKITEHFIEHGAGDSAKTAKDGEPVDKSEAVRNFRYGQSSVTMTDEQFSLTLLEGLEPGLKVIQFVKRESLPREWFMGNVQMLLPPPTSNRDKMAFDALAQACLIEQRVIIARFVKLRNPKGPEVVALLPRKKTSHYCMYMVKIPFYDDYRTFPFNVWHDNPKHCPRGGQVLNWKQLITHLNLAESGPLDEDGDKTEALNMKEIYCPAHQRLYRNIENRALDPASKIMDCQAEVQAYLKQDSKLFQNAEQAITDFKNNFKFEIVPKKKRGKRKQVNWFAPILGEDGDAEPSAMDIDDTMPSQTIDPNFGLEPIVTKIGSADPVADFKSMMQKRTDGNLIKKLASQMYLIIKQLIAESSDYFPKAIKCVKTIRQACIVETEPDLFNKWLRNFKMESEANEEEESLWDLIIDNEITLICLDDFPNDLGACCVTKQEAEDFLKKKVIAPVLKAPSLAQAMDEDDSDDEF